MCTLWMILVATMLFVVSAVPLAQTAVGASLDHVSASAQLPACTLDCATDLVDLSLHPMADMQEWLCTNITLQGQVFECMTSSCDPSQQHVSLNLYQNTICKGTHPPSRSVEMIRVIATISGVTLPIFCLRIYGRYRQKELRVDDWVALATAGFLIPMAVIPIYNASKGFGKHIWDVRPENAVLIRKLFYVSQLFYYIVQNSTKVSVLLFYLRIFPSNRFRLLVKAFIIWIITAGLSFFIASATQCIPIEALWDLNLRDASCTNPIANVAAGAGFSIAEDIVIMALPIPQLLCLRMSLKKRVTLVVMFMIGSFACVTSMIRLKYIVHYNSHPLDITWQNVDVVIWSVLEVFSAMICACLMAIRPLLVKYLPLLFATANRSPIIPSWSSSRRNSWPFGNRGSGGRRNCFGFGRSDGNQGQQNNVNRAPQIIQQRIATRYAGTGGSRVGLGLGMDGADDMECHNLGGITTATLSEYCLPSDLDLGEPAVDYSSVSSESSLRIY